jgi:hypothetical protein
MVESKAYLKDGTKNKKKAKTSSIFQTRTVDGLPG